MSEMLCLDPLERARRAKLRAHSMRVTKLGVVRDHPLADCERSRLRRACPAWLRVDLLPQPRGAHSPAHGPRLRFRCVHIAHRGVSSSRAGSECTTVAPCSWPRVS